MRAQRSIEVKDRWVKVSVTMDTGAAGHVMLKRNVPTCETRAQNITKETCGSEW